MNYKVKKIGKTKVCSTQYVVLNSLNMIVAVFFVDDDTKAKYRIKILDDTYSVVKRIMEVIDAYKGEE